MAARAAVPRARLPREAKPRCDALYPERAPPKRMQAADSTPRARWSADTTPRASPTSPMTPFQLGSTLLPKAQRRTPGRVVAIQEPAKIWCKRQQQPRRYSERASDMRDGRIDGDLSNIKLAEISDRVGVNRKCPDPDPSTAILRGRIILPECLLHLSGRAKKAIVRHSSQRGRRLHNDYRIRSTRSF